MDEHYGTTLTHRVILALLLGSLLALGYGVLHLFIIPVAWAIILAHTTWPLYERLRRLLGGNVPVSAFLMTLLLTAAFVLPLLWLIALLQGEMMRAYDTVAAYLATGPHPLPDVIIHIPWLDEWLQAFLKRLTDNPVALRAQVAQWGEQWIGQLGEIIGNVGRNALKLGFAVLTLFFLYRDGESVLNQVRLVFQRFLGDRTNSYLTVIGDTTRAVVCGLVLAALAQGVLAGFGYWAAGVQAPVLLGAFTALIALIPFGPPLVWGTLSVWLLLTGHTFAGVGLLIWGILVVSGVDNLIRPLVISSATQIPSLLVLFGVLGGLAAFGLVGLFLGPAVLAIMMVVWREWLEEQVPERRDKRHLD